MRDEAPDVVVVGGGIAGLGAALRLQDRGLRPLVLESASRVGGRMTTDRVDGFIIDRGATLFGRRFHHLLALADRLGLGPQVRPAEFSIRFEDEDGFRQYRAPRLDDFLADRRLSRAARLASLRMGLDIVRHARAMAYGPIDAAARIDTEDARHYLSGLGRGGEELFDRVFEPALKSPLGGSLAPVSRATMFQVIWHTFGFRLWNLRDGIDRLPEAIAARVPVRTGARALAVRYGSEGVEIDAEAGGEAWSIAARGAILAVPGNLVPILAPQLPDWIAGPAGRAEYSKIVCVTVALRRPPETRVTAHAYAANGPEGVGILELAHNRAPGCCPEGMGMVTAHLLHTPAYPCVELDDEALRARAIDAVRRAFPEVRGDIRFAHLVRWPIAVARFPAGRLRELVRLRRGLAGWDAPVDLCGDYLDAPATESALVTGQQAADRLADRLAAGSRAPSRLSRTDAC